MREAGAGWTRNSEKLKTRSPRKREKLIKMLIKMRRWTRTKFKEKKNV
jgi:hypothetical protein